MEGKREADSNLDAVKQSIQYQIVCANLETTDIAQPMSKMVLRNNLGKSPRSFIQFAVRLVLMWLASITRPIIFNITVSDHTEAGKIALM